MRVEVQWKPLSVVRGNSLLVAAKLLYWSAVMHSLHVGDRSSVDTDGEVLADNQQPCDIETDHIRCLYFSLLQCLLQV